MIAYFPERLTQRIPDELALGELAKTPEGNIFKLKTFLLPSPSSLSTFQNFMPRATVSPHILLTHRMLRKKLSKLPMQRFFVVNPVLREGNSDSRFAPPVKENGKKIIKRSPVIRPWKENGQRSVVASIANRGFFSAEQSYIMPSVGCVEITLHHADGITNVLQEPLALQAC